MRQQRTATDSRHLSAALSESGDLLVEGQDIGASVRLMLGGGEYEWSHTVGAAHLPALKAALGVDSDVLAALRARFEGDKTFSFESFLKLHAIPYSFWSRTGD